MTTHISATEAGEDACKYAWENVLLTDSGFYYDNDPEKPLTALINRFAAMLKKPFDEAKVLLIPTAAMANRAKAEEITERLRAELLHMGVLNENIKVHNVDGSMSEKKAMMYDVVYFTGGSAPYLAKRLRKTGFDNVVKKMVYSNKALVGVSGGSMVAMADFNVKGLTEKYPMQFKGLALINAYFTVHCNPGTPNRTDLPLPHISLMRNQAIAVRWDGYEVIDG